MFEEEGGKLTYWPEFGEDPLMSDDLQQERQNYFEASFPNYDVLFQRLVIGEILPFKNAVILFRDLTIQLSLSVIEV